jgi:hypothetical protein
MSTSVVNRAVFLSLLLSSVSAFAATPVEPASEALQARENNALQRQPAYRHAGTPEKSSIKRVYKDDYERHLVTVSRPRNTDMVWLRKNRSDPSQKSKMIWIGKKAKSD